MQKLCCVRTRQQFSASLVHLSPAYQTISPSILNHFRWELYQVDADMFIYVMKSKIEELIDEKLNKEFPEEVEIRENQDYDSEEEMTSETEDR